jgi:hypothetical protein
MKPCSTVACPIPIKAVKSDWKLMEVVSLSSFLDYCCTTKILQHDPRESLDLSSHAYRSVNVSFAVVSEQGPSQFSEHVTLDVYGGEGA